MTRQIKFRAWWKHPQYMPEGKMYFVGGLVFAKQQEGEPEYDMTGNVKEVGLMNSENNSKIGWNPGDECVLMQFTGLLDKNGKEIYEGDIVQRNGVETWTETGKGTCTIQDIRHLQHIMFHEGYEIEIIGNIYQNPELLK